MKAQNNQTPVIVAIDSAVNAPSIPTQTDFETWITLALQDKNTPTEVSVYITDEDEIAQLNKRYRKKDGPTNILSFPAEHPFETESPLLGDLVICAAVIEREAKAHGKLEKHHWAHIIIHGMLHLLGYDHITDAEANIMESLEIKLLDELGIPNPYGDTVSHE